MLGKAGQPWGQPKRVIQFASSRVDFVTVRLPRYRVCRLFADGLTSTYKAGIRRPMTADIL